MFRLAAIFFIGALSACATAPAQKSGVDGDAGSAASELISRFFDNIPSDLASSTDPKSRSIYMQTLTLVGREDLHASIRDWPGRARPCSDTNADNRSAVAEIKARAAETRIVIINEAHDQPHHRAFIQQVASSLRDVNYTVYAAETFSPFIAESQQIPYTRIRDGYYSNEPAFGELIRQVKQLGYRLAPYEHIASSTDTSLSTHERATIREEGQAENLAAIFAKLGNGQRLLVHVGYSHAAEVPIASFDGKKLAWMAARLKTKTVMDPLTIDQTSCESVDSKIHVLKDAGRVVPGQFDIQIAHPPTRFKRGRPEWREKQGEKPVAVPQSFLQTNTRVIIEARKHSEPLDSVPADRILLWPGEHLPLLLRPGVYDVIAYSEEQGVVGVEKVVVR